MDKLNFLKELKVKGIEFGLSIPGQWGQHTYYATPAEVLEYLDNPISLYAKYYGVFVREYLLWVEDGHSVKCSAKTKSGKQCRNTVTGGSNVDPKVWVEMQNEYCAVHGEGTEF